MTLTGQSSKSRQGYIGISRTEPKQKLKTKAKPKCLYSRQLWVFGSETTELCAEGRSSVRARTEVCARKDGYSPDDNV